MGLGKLFKSIFRLKNENIYNEEDEDLKLEEVIYSPMIGQVKKLNEVSDPTFGQELMGKGIAIEPKQGRVVSPVEGTVKAMVSTKHALALKSNDGVEVLIHVGIDTVNLEGKYFRAYVDQGFHVKVGDLLLEFNVEAIKNEGYDVITSIVVSNTEDYSTVNVTDKKEIKESEPLINVVR
jgi:PTS system beta-glucosides-specific IIC component